MIALRRPAARPPAAPCAHLPPCAEALPHRGVAAVEFAVLLPFLMFLALLVGDWARLLYLNTALESCARNGALFASDPTAMKLSPYYTGPADAQVAASTRTAALAETTDLTPTVADPVYTYSADGTTKLTVQVTATMTFHSTVGFSFQPVFSIPSTQTVSRTVRLRMAP